MNQENLAMLERALEHLGVLANDFVFVGGAIVDLWASPGISGVIGGRGARQKQPRGPHKQGSLARARHLPLSDTSTHWITFSSW